MESVIQVVMGIELPTAMLETLRSAPSAALSACVWLGRLGAMDAQTCLIVATDDQPARCRSLCTGLHWVASATIVGSVITMSSTERVHALVDDRLALTVGLGALLFLAVGVAQFLFDTAPNVWAPSWVAIFTAAVLGAEGLLLWRRRDVIKRVSAPIVVTATAVVVAINPLV
ncbi:hypothetical protein [Gordonia sp. N1V]|uniref:hypothetical protein n=1 Tax=Gordonia sp. N1V TaxID=3034163 RepID=UPI0023E32FCF|nr:hypothetical protein [Gordonia sp. N1V]MDF3284053.1 hypothetical protein [Gordonia sp. N1V]